MDHVRFSILLALMFLSMALVIFRNMDWGLRAMVALQTGAWAVAFASITPPRPMTPVGWLVTVLLIGAYVAALVPLLLGRAARSGSIPLVRSNDPGASS